MIKEKGDEIAFDYLYPYLFKTYKDDCFPIFFERIQKATKDEKKVLFKLLSKKQEYSEQYKTLLNSEQSSIKKLGEKLLSTLVLK